MSAVELTTSRENLHLQGERSAILLSRYQRNSWTSNRARATADLRPPICCTPERRSRRWLPLVCIPELGLRRIRNEEGVSPVDPERALDLCPESMCSAMSISGISLQTRKLGATSVDWDHAGELEGAELSVKWVYDISICIPRRGIGDELGCNSLQTQLSFSPECACNGRTMSPRASTRSSSCGTLSQCGQRYHNEMQTFFKTSKVVMEGGRLRPNAWGMILKNTCQMFSRKGAVKTHE